ncbi:MAG: apolipoprotein N-acyltransferase [Candidatus Omnitrophota bacterium]
MLAAIVSALLYAGSFPKPAFFVLGFFFLVPMLGVLEKRRKRGKSGHGYPFFLFFLFGMVSYLILLSWIPNVMHQYGGANMAVSIVGLVALALFLSLFNGLAGIFIDDIINRPAPILLPALLIPLIWVSKDLIIEHIFGGFPWCLAGYSQFKNIYFIQIAEWGGIHLITFLVLFFNVLFYKWMRSETKRDKRLVLAALLIGFISVYAIGYYLYRSNEAKISTLESHKAGIIQPNTRNEWMSQEKKDQILERLFNESRELVRQGASFIVWPEHTVDIYPLQHAIDFTQRRYYDRIMDFVHAEAPLLAGFTDLKEGQSVYNSAMLFQANGVSQYDKVHLTPFGEYIPFRKLLFFVKRITDEISDFTPGSRVKNLVFNGHPISIPICYEIIFPELVRAFIHGEGKPGELIVTISNDSWFGNTSAPYQHLSMAIFRSIENRRFILRSTTNGISGTITPLGEIRYRSRYHTADHFNAGFKFIRYETVFTRFGYLFPYLCALGVLIFYLSRMMSAFRRRRK